MGILRYPENIGDIGESGGEDSPDTNANASYIEFQIYDRPNSQKSTLETNIFLYMPLQMDNPLSVQWDQAGIGQAGQAYLDGGASNALGASIVAGSSAFSKKLREFMKSSAAGFDVEKGKAIEELSRGEIANPYLKMLFRGLNFRSFEFQFKFTPHSEKESTDIKNIIKEFRKAALPDREVGSYYMKYPKEVKIEYHHNGKTHPFLNKFKSCVITDLNVNYTGSGFYAAMRDGFPAETTLRMRFTENELVFRKDIDQDF